jgi:hypothetical protein
MPVPSSQDVAQPLAWRHGEQTVLENLRSLVHKELPRLAHRYMHGERPDHTLQTTALLSEAYLRQIDSQRGQTAEVLKVSPGK